MSIVWIVEKPKPDSLISKMVGDFAVRGFASPQTLYRFMKMGGEAKPALILVSMDDFDQESVKTLLNDAHIPSVFLTRDEIASANPIKSPSRIVHYPQESFVLSRIVRFWIDKYQPERSTAKHLMAFRDIQFDPTRQHLAIGDGSDAQTLTSKESKLLLFLIQNAGTMLNRAQLRDAVWDGMAVSPRTIDSHVSRLRTRLRDSLVEVESVYGGGYILK